MKKISNKILSQIKSIVQQQDPAAKIYLFGSRSKGTANTRSDWDLLILLNKDEITPLAEQAITHPLYDLEFDTGEIISPQVYSIKEWNNKYRFTAFYQNIMQEGILL